MPHRRAPRCNCDKTRKKRLNHPGSDPLAGCGPTMPRRHFPKLKHKPWMARCLCDACGEDRRRWNKLLFMAALALVLLAGLSALVITYVMTATTRNRVQAKKIRIIGQ
ncbi:hypothetical protein QBC37DRAFT_403406 [Rhypophila decipiens]|uniref:Uncharacterized protein n=1 Tax=Rhypophila decipiens TaxID=261697 RepID=A0AAN6Y116_9PEZI|nr:hypothetical protein QBC37DRAFT_403406 [Rhypophila decipiens]